MSLQCRPKCLVAFEELRVEAAVELLAGGGREPLEQRVVDGVVAVLRVDGALERLRQPEDPKADRHAVALEDLRPPGSGDLGLVLIEVPGDVADMRERVRLVPPPHRASDVVERTEVVWTRVGTRGQSRAGSVTGAWHANRSQM